MSAMRQTGVNPGAIAAYNRRGLYDDEDLKEKEAQIDESVINRITKKLSPAKIATLNSVAKMSSTTDSVANALKNNAQIASIASEALTALTALSTLTNTTRQAKMQAKQNTYLNTAANNIYGGITPSGAGVNLGLMNHSYNSIKGIAGTVGTISALNDLLSGNFLANGGLSNTTKVAYGIANPAFGLMSLLGGFGKVGAGINAAATPMVNAGLNSAGGLMGMKGLSVGGATGMLGSGLDLATGGAAFLAINKAMGMVGDKIKEMDPNNVKNVKKNQFSTTFGVRRYATEDSMEAAEHARTLSFVKTLGPAGMNSLTIAESMSLSLLSGIKFNTSFMPTLTNMIQDLQQNSSPNVNKGNNVLNSALSTFGIQDHSGKEFDSLLRNGKPDTFTKSLLGVSNFFTQLSTLNPGTLISNAFNGRDINEAAWTLRDAKQNGDMLAADKMAAKQFGISLNDSSILRADLEGWIANQDDKQLALAYYQAKLMRISTMKIVELVKNSGGSKDGKNESLGSLSDRLNLEQQMALQEKHSFLIDGVLRSMDDTLRKIPILKVLSPLLHLGAQGAKGLFNLSKLEGSDIKNYFGSMFKDAKDSFISKYMDPSVKNETDLRNAVGMNEVSLEERFYAYMVNVFPNEFQKLLGAVGVKNAANLVSDKYSTDWVSAQELKNRNKSKLDSLNELLTREMPADESVSGWLKDKIGRKAFGINDMGASIKDLASKNFGYIDEMNQSIEDDDINLDSKMRSDKFKKKRRANSGNSNNSNNSHLTSNTHLSSIDANILKLLECCEALKALQQETMLKLFKDNVSESAAERSKKAFARNKNKTVTDVSNDRIIAERKFTMYQVTKNNLPYLEKIYTLLEDKFKPSQLKKNEEIKNDIPQTGLFDGLLDFLGFGGGGKDGKNAKDAKGKSKGFWGAIKSGLGWFMKQGKLGITAILTALPFLAPLGPVGVALGVVALVAGAGALIYTYWDDIKKAFNGGFDWLVSSGGKAFDWIADKIDWISKKFQGFKDWITGNNVPNATTDNFNNGKISEINDVMKNGSTKDKLDKLDKLSNDKSTQGSTKEVRDYANLKRKELAEQLNKESYTKYGVDINSNDMLKYTDQIKNLSAKGLTDLQADYTALNKAENNVGSEEQKMRDQIQAQIRSNLDQAHKQIGITAKMSDTEKSEYNKLNPKFDSLLEQLKELNISIDPSKSNQELLNGLHIITSTNVGGINSVAKSIQEVATATSAVTMKMLERSTNKMEFVLNNKILDIIPGLTSLGSDRTMNKSVHSF